MRGAFGVWREFLRIWGLREYAVLRSRQVACVECIDERSEEPTFAHRMTAKAIPHTDESVGNPHKLVRALALTATDKKATIQAVL